MPFCRTKCSFCNFASGVTSRAVYRRYVDRICADIAASQQTVVTMGAPLEGHADSIYFGGGTPTVLDPAEMERIFRAIGNHFRIDTNAEITVECAPGTLSAGMIDSLLRCGVNRVSLGVQSFVDKESAAVGRLHTRAVVLSDIALLRSAGITNIGIDLIAGLPHQSPESWRYSLSETLASGVPHVSVYMLEVDDESRLGKELIAGGTRYHAHFVPNDDAVAAFYTEACERLESGGLRQYEISNFAAGPLSAKSGVRQNAALPAMYSRHNLKYWEREPYLGFGVDAHSMLPLRGSDFEAVRFATADTLEQYLQGRALDIQQIGLAQAQEESYFLGLRLNCGVDLNHTAARYGSGAVNPFQAAIDDLCREGMLTRCDGTIRLTAQGRLLSNDVFERFLASPQLQD
ncbi:MAG TPA: radical SAM family heme chaperone HemW [Terriglobales bacterium]|nr:radical SAM family heme chaperone HemW [Terriglobales bacterium]